MATQKQPSIHPSLHPATAATARAASLSAAGGETKLLLFMNTEKTTPFSPALLEQMARVKTLFAQWTKVIEKIRCAAQPNPLFRGERLVPSATNAFGDRHQYSIALRDCALACFDNVKPLGEYMTEMANAEFSISGFHDVMLRQVMLFSVKPLKDYTTLHYPRIMAAYGELEKKRNAYDAARHKKAPNMQTAQKDLCEQAAALETMLNTVSELQMAGAKAIDLFVRAEIQFMRELMSVTKAVKRPENKRRWNQK